MRPGNQCRDKGCFTASTFHTDGTQVYKRGTVGIYQHCGEQHLQRYLAEFDFGANHRAKLGYDDAMHAGKAFQFFANN